MFYISPDNQYPLCYGDIQLANPGWKLGDPLPEGWIAVSESPLPEPSENQIISEGFPIEVDGQMTRNWVIRDLTPEEIERKNAPITARKKLMGLGLTEAEINALVSGMI